MQTRMSLRGRFHVEHIRDGKTLAKYEVRNAITDEGLNHILETEFKSGAAVATWYIGLVDNANWTAFAPGDVMNSHTGWVECAAYTAADRPAWTPGDAASRHDHQCSLPWISPSTIPRR